jgi:Trk K+ transport system NAD-binding subunit
LIVLIGRDDELVTPNGGTVIESGDTLLVMADKRARAEVRAIVGSPHQTEPPTIKPSVTDSDRH